MMAEKIIMDVLFEVEMSSDCGNDTTYMDMLTSQGNYYNS